MKKFQRKKEDFEKKNKTAPNDNFGILLQLSKEKNKNHSLDKKMVFYK